MLSVHLPNMIEVTDRFSIADIPSLICNQVGLFFSATYFAQDLKEKAANSNEVVRVIK